MGPWSNGNTKPCSNYGFYRNDVALAIRNQFHPGLTGEAKTVGSNELRVSKFWNSHRVHQYCSQF